MNEFMFATGMECSSPTIENGYWRVDELDATDHYRRWREDLKLVRAVGLKYFRYNLPPHIVCPTRSTHDWSFADQVISEMKRLGITPIIDLCHFGLPDWLGSFQNEEFPAWFGNYALAFAERYPWIGFYTPINEMYVTARFSALEGLWNEQMRSERAFVTATKNIVKAALLAVHAIRRVHPRAVFVTSESSELFHPCCPDPAVKQIADFENRRRFLALDLFYGIPLEPCILSYLTDNGLTRAEHEWFVAHKLEDQTILGIDYYITNEKMINVDKKQEFLGELFGWYVITQQYYARYKHPLMHTETNCPDAKHAEMWLWRQWHNVQLMRSSGVPVVGFTWYSLLDQVDWDIGLERPDGNVNPVGLFDLNRDPRPVAFAYKYLIEMFQNETVNSDELSWLMPKE